MTENNIKIKSLAASKKPLKNRDDFRRTYYTFSFQSLESGHQLVTSNANFLRTQFIRTILSNLKQLFIDVERLMEREPLFSLVNDLNQLTSLEELDIESSVSFDKPHTLKLPNLRMMSFCEYHGARLKLDTPKLSAFKVASYALALKHFEFVYPEFITHLYTRFYDPIAERFVNLQSYSVEYFEYTEEVEEMNEEMEVEVVDEVTHVVPVNVLSLLPKLKQLHFTEVVDTLELSRILANKIRFGRDDFSFYYQGIGIGSVDELNEFADPDEEPLLIEFDENSFQMVLNNFSRLSPFVPWIDAINYSRLISFFGSQIDDAFLRRFLNRFIEIRVILVDAKVNDAMRLLKFLGACKVLRTLKVKNAGFDQRVYDQLPLVVSRISSLTVTEAFDLDLEFIFKLKRLHDFQVDQMIPFALISRAYEELPNFVDFHFKLNHKSIHIYASHFSRFLLFFPKQQSFSFSDKAKLLKCVQDLLEIHSM